MAALIASGRRDLLKIAAVGGAAYAGGLIVPSAFAAKPRKKQSEKEAEVTPPEDLMREHGVLDRLLLVYEAGLRKFAANEDFDPAIITTAAETVRDFIENYHEKSEEEAVFPRFKEGRQTGAAPRHSADAASSRTSRHAGNPSIQPRQPQGRRRAKATDRFDPGVHRDVPPACRA
jgi:hypothetical protein